MTTQLSRYMFILSRKKTDSHLQQVDMDDEKTSFSRFIKRGRTQINAAISFGILKLIVPDVDLKSLNENGYT